MDSENISYLSVNFDEGSNDTMTISEWVVMSAKTTDSLSRQHDSIHSCVLDRVLS